jgi:response regulator RpfG family c-di-GMP phosphodiesterase
MAPMSLFPKDADTVVAELSEAIDARSPETGWHVRRVAEYSRLLGELAGLDAASTELLFVAAPLHDAGKIAIPDDVLHKPGPHTAEESTIMRTHAELGRSASTIRRSCARPRSSPGSTTSVGTARATPKACGASRSTSSAA